VNWFLLIALLPTAVALLLAVLLTLQAHEHGRYVRASLRSSPRPWHRPPKVLVCVPCKGLDLDLASNLRGVLSQSYPDYQVRFVVESASDPAHAVIQQLIATTHVPCELLVAGVCTDSGQKVHNLLCATMDLPDDIEMLAFFDSDAKPAPNALARLVDRVCRGRLQVATGYRWFVPRRPSLANLTLASVNASVAGLLNRQGWNLVWGGSWAITRKVFDKTALASAWRGTLSDDLVASRVVHAAGVKLAFEPGCMAATLIDVNWREAVSFLRRQFLIGRCYVPLWWWALIPLLVLQPAVLFGGLLLGCYMAWQGLSYWYAPLLVSGVLYALSELRARWRQDAWSSRVSASPDALRAAARFDRLASSWSCLFASGVMLASAVGRTITWRGIQYHMGPAGRVTLLGRVPSLEHRREMTEEQVRKARRDKVARCATDNAVNQAPVQCSDELPREQKPSSPSPLSDRAA
jgi:ceramide glucosyltransferase